MLANVLVIWTTWPERVPTARVPSLATSMSMGLANQALPPGPVSVTLPSRAPVELKWETVLSQLAVKMSPAALTATAR
jgi:hypothetical protein